MSERQARTGHSTLTFHLTPDLRLGRPAPGGGPAGGTDGIVEVPEGPSALLACPTSGARLVPLDRHEPGRAPVVLEPLRGNRRPLLSLLAATGSRTVRVNGLPAPSVALLAPGDQVQLGGELVLHVALYRRPFVGAAGTTHAGAPCPVCRGRARPEDIVYECPRCAAVLHVESKAADGEEPLECVLVSTTCPVCLEDVNMTEGYSHPC